MFSYFVFCTTIVNTPTLTPHRRHGVLCNLSSSQDTSGFPCGSVLEFADDGQGRPILSTSTLSPHTADLMADGRCSLTVMAPGFKVLYVTIAACCVQ